MLKVILVLTLAIPCNLLFLCCVLDGKPLRRWTALPVVFFPGFSKGLTIHGPVGIALLIEFVAFLWFLRGCFIRGGIVATSVATVASIILSHIQGKISFQPLRTIPVSLVGTFVLYNALVEEFLLRWLPLFVWRISGLNGVAGFGTYAFVTSVLFGIWHVETQGWLSAISKFLMGVLWAWLAWYYGIPCSYVAHASVNAFALLSADKCFFLGRHLHPRVFHLRWKSNHS